MGVLLNPYIGFKDNAREALEYYHSIFGGKLDVNTFKDFHASEDAAEDNKIMHGQLTGEDGLTIMASDTPNRMEYKDGARISISLSGSDEDKLRGYFDKLSDGGKVTIPMDKAPWGDIFGMCTDKFGVSWMVDCSPDQSSVA